MTEFSQLLEAVKAKAPKAESELWQLFLPELNVYIEKELMRFRQLRSLLDPGDLANSCIVEALESQKFLENPTEGSFKSITRTAARDRIVLELRRMRNQRLPTKAANEKLDSATGASTQVQREENLELKRAEIERGKTLLTADQQSILDLYDKELPDEKIAQLLGIGEGAMRMRLKRAISALKRVTREP